MQMRRRPALCSVCLSGSFPFPPAAASLSTSLLADVKLSAAAKPWRGKSNVHTAHESRSLFQLPVLSVLPLSLNLSLYFNTPPLSFTRLSLCSCISASPLSLYFTNPSLSLSLSFTLSSLSLYKSHILFRRTLLKVTVTSPMYFSVECSWWCTDGAEDVL